MPAPHAGALPLVQRGHFALQPFRLLGVPLAQLQQLRGQPGLNSLTAEGTEAERHEENPDGHRERDDRGHRGQSAENGGEDTGEPGDEVVAASTGTPKILNMGERPSSYDG